MRFIRYHVEVDVMREWGDMNISFYSPNTISKGDWVDLYHDIDYKDGSYIHMDFSIEVDRVTHGVFDTFEDSPSELEAYADIHLDGIYKESRCILAYDQCGDCVSLTIEQLHNSDNWKELIDNLFNKKVNEKSNS